MSTVKSKSLKSVNQMEKEIGMNEVKSKSLKSVGKARKSSLDTKKKQNRLSHLSQTKKAPTPTYCVYLNGEQSDYIHESTFIRVVQLDMGEKRKKKWSVFHRELRTKTQWNKLTECSEVRVSPSLQQVATHTDAGEYGVLTERTRRLCKYIVDDCGLVSLSGPLRSSVPEDSSIKEWGIFS